MCKYSRCVSGWPICKISFAKQVMVRISLADAMLLLNCMCVFVLGVLFLNIKTCIVHAYGYAHMYHVCCMCVYMH